MLVSLHRREGGSETASEIIDCIDLRVARRLAILFANKPAADLASVGWDGREIRVDIRGGDRELIETITISTCGVDASDTAHAASCAAGDDSAYEYVIGSGGASRRKGYKNN